jgi:(p)ppGpp synthase/HD superfamily hydrolase
LSSSVVLDLERDSVIHQVKFPIITLHSFPHYKLPKPSRILSLEEIKNYEKPFTTQEETASFLAELGVSNKKINDIFDLIEIIHGAQTRDDGMPYPEQHLYPVAKKGFEYYKGRGFLSIRESRELAADVVIAYLLHDIVEDGSGLFSFQDIEDIYGKLVKEIVYPLTKHKVKFIDDNPYVDKNKAKWLVNHYIYYRLLSISSEPTIRGKGEDRSVNLDTTDYHTSLEKAIKYIGETREFVIPLVREVDPKLADTLESKTKDLVDRVNSYIHHGLYQEQVA